MFMGFTIHFYIIFGTNLLIGGPTRIAIFFAYFSVSKKRDNKQSPNGMKPLGAIFLEQTQSGRLEWTSRSSRGGHEGARHALGGWARPHHHGPLVAPLTGLLRLYISTYPKNILEHHEKLFPPPQSSVTVRPTRQGRPP